jgi:hypothetical protein
MEKKRLIKNLVRRFWLRKHALARNITIIGLSYSSRINMKLLNVPYIIAWYDYQLPCDELISRDKKISP